jgi:hypothetical protein
MTRKSSHILLFSIFCLLGIYSVSCLKLDDETEIIGSDAEYAFPLFSSQFTIDDLLSKTLNDTLPGDTLLIAPDGSITLIYSGDVTEVKATNLYKFLEQPFGGPIPLLDTLFYVPFDAPPNVDIYKARLKQGTILCAGINNFNEQITGSIQVPQLKKNGVSYRYDFVSPANGNLVSLQEDLTGYELVSTNDSLFFRYEAYLPNGDRVKLTTLGILINDVKFSYLEGYWGNEAFPIDRDTIEIDINQTNFTNGDIKIKDPRVTVTISNSFGFPARGHIKALQFKGRDGIFYPLVSDTITSGGIDFDYPKLQLGEVGQVRNTVFKFDKTNSNIDVIFNAQPVAMDYDVEGIANVMLNPNLIGFLTDSSFIKFNVKVELPLEGSVRNFGADNDVAVDFGDQSGTSASDIASAEFKLVTENGMPVGATGQIYFLDSQDMIIDSLFSALTPILKPAPVDANGVPTQIAKYEQLIPISGDQFVHIRNAKKARIRTVIETSGNGGQNVKVLSKQKTDIRMGLKIALKR